MPSTTSIISKLKNSYPDITFLPSDKFFWSSSEVTIYYDDKSDLLPVFLLHELSHALLKHNNYENDIQLLTMERQAWDKAIELAGTFNINISNYIVQSNLDSYRDWLHARSTCPSCNAIGLQSREKSYICHSCGNSWRANEAKNCALRRYNK